MRLNVAPSTRASYDLACALALSVSAARLDKGLSADDRSACAERYARASVAWLRKVHVAGFFQTPVNLEHFSKDADFDPIRNRDDFKQFLADMQTKK
jgi:hypothetical protein